MAGGHSFDERAATWDDDPAKVERASVVADAIRASIPLDRSVRMLEYGAGTGLVTQALRATVGPVTLADTSAGMREVLADKIERGLLPGARIWDVDLSTAPPPDEQFDLVVTVMALHHVTPVEPALSAFATLLTSGGHLCVVDLDEEDGSFHDHGFEGHHGFAPSRLTSLLTAAGFTDIDIRPCHEVVRDRDSFPLFLATARV